MSPLINDKKPMRLCNDFSRLKIQDRLATNGLHVMARYSLVSISRTYYFGGRGTNKQSTGEDSLPDPSLENNSPSPFAVI